MLASDVNNPQFAGAVNPDQALSVWFFSKPVQSPFKTLREGRPIFEDVIYIHIESGGNRLSIIERPKYASDEERFSQQWQAFLNKHGREALEIGTPLTAWPLITAAQAEELKAMKFRTVESIANASDSSLQSLGMMAGMAPHAFRDRAKAFLMAAQNAQAVAEQSEALKEAQEREAHREEVIAELREQVAKLTEIAMAPEAPKKRRGMPKGGWPKKPTEAQT